MTTRSFSPLALLFAALSAFLLGASIFLTLAIGAIAEGTRQQQHALVCFDAHGRVTQSDNFKECRMVGIRELAR